MTRWDNCPEIDSFPEGGLPTNLSELHIRNCNKLVANRMEWGLQTLPFLRTLGIEGCEKERFPRSDFCPPLSPPLKLGVFQIWNPWTIRGFSTSPLLKLWRFGNVETSSPSQNRGCPPPFLVLILRDKGKKWPKISHIPCITYDGEDEVILSWRPSIQALALLCVY